VASTLRFARPDEVEEIRALIVSESMPAMEIEERLDGFLVLDDGGRLVGCAGVEIYGDSAVLRSVMIDPALRGTGEGVRLAERCLAYARERGAVRCYLFTMTAPDFFARFGFERCTLDDFEPPARESWQWRAVTENEPLRKMLTPMRANL
jgi:N-acetylglutamate synthase-like GNAT family acetyltransferase